MLRRDNWLVSKDLVFLRDTSKVVGKQKVNCDVQLLKQTVADRTDQFGLLFCVQNLEEYTALIYPLFHSHRFNSPPFMAALLAPHAGQMFWIPISIVDLSIQRTQTA